MALSLFWSSTDQPLLAAMLSLISSLGAARSSCIPRPDRVRPSAAAISAVRMATTKGSKARLLRPIAVSCPASSGQRRSGLVVEELTGARRRIFGALGDLGAASQFDEPRGRRVRRGRSVGVERLARGIEQLGAIGLRRAVAQDGAVGRLDGDQIVP